MIQREDIEVDISAAHGQGKQYQVLSNDDRLFLIEEPELWLSPYLMSKIKKEVIATNVAIKHLDSLNSISRALSKIQQNISYPDRTLFLDLDIYKIESNNTDSCLEKEIDQFAFDNVTKQRFKKLFEQYKSSKNVKYLLEIREFIDEQKSKLSNRIGDLKKRIRKLKSKLYYRHAIASIVIGYYGGEMIKIPVDDEDNSSVLQALELSIIKSSYYGRKKSIS